MTEKQIETPCIKVCAVDGELGLCIGCGRSLQEIGAWTRFTDAERRDIIDALPERLHQLQAAGKLSATS